MNRQKMGELLTVLRIEKGIAQENLCMGLCTQSAYSKFERGVQIPDRLLLNALLQRMGKAPDKLAMVLSAEEYNYFRWKKEVLIAAGQNNMDVLEKLLERKEAVQVTIHENLQKQFLYLMQAIVAEDKEKDIEKSIALLERAAELTMPGIVQNGMQEYLVSIEEMYVLLELSDMLLKVERIEEAGRLLLEIVEYADKKYDDYEAKVKVYPKAAKLLYPILLEKEQECEAMNLCRKAVELLCWQGILYDLTELLTGYLVCSEKFPVTEDRIRYEKQLQALKEVCEEYDAKDYGIENARLAYRSQELYLLDELIKGSRIETGKRSPSTKNFRALMQKLETGQDYYNGTLDTEDFWLLEKKRKLDRAMSLKKWDEARLTLDYLKAKLDMNKVQNRRELAKAENSINFWTGKLTSEEYIVLCEKALGCGREGWREEGFWKQFFTSYKVELLNSIVVAYGRLKKSEESIFILEHLLDFFQNSKVELEDRYQTSMTVVENLSYHYGETGKLDKCLEMCERGMKLCLESGRGVRISTFLGNKAEARNILANEALEESKKYLRQAYYISDLMAVYTSKDYIDNYYHKNYEADIVWY